MNGDRGPGNSLFLTRMSKEQSRGFEDAALYVTVTESQALHNTGPPWEPMEDKRVYSRQGQVLVSTLKERAMHLHFQGWDKNRAWP